MREGKTIPFTVDADAVLRKLTDQEAFYFRNAEIQLTGAKAVSLEDFSSKILEADAASLSYHFY